MNLPTHKISFVVNQPLKYPRVDIFLKENTEFQRDFIKKNSILVNGLKAKPSHKLKLNDHIHFIYIEEVKEPNPLLKPEKMDLDILFEDEYLIVLNKPRGVVTHPARGNWSNTLANGIAYHLNIAENEHLRPGIIHRLDKDTSGLMIVAKNLESQNKLIPLFKERKILKIYHALVKGFLKKSHDIIDLPIGRHPNNRILFAVNENSDKSKEAVSEYHVLKEWKKTSLIKIRIHTGRTHQIRVHFSHIGNPLIGDSLYSSVYKDFPLCLCASKIAFTHPFTQEKMEFEIPIPNDMQDIIKYFTEKK